MAENGNGAAARRSRRTAVGVLELPPLQRTTLADRTADLLKRCILADELRPGDRLPPERALAERLNASRVVLREALSRLMGEGILYFESPRVLKVAEFERSEIVATLLADGGEELPRRSMVELRVIVEVGMMRLVAARITEAQLTELERLVSDIEHRVRARQPTNRLDAQFHKTLVKASGNPVLIRFLPLIEESIRVSLIFHPSMTAPANKAMRVAGEHRMILEALQARDADRATQAMSTHLQTYLALGDHPQPLH